MAGPVHMDLAPAEISKTRWSADVYAPSEASVTSLLRCQAAQCRTAQSRPDHVPRGLQHGLLTVLNHAPRLCVTCAPQDSFALVDALAAQARRFSGRDLLT